MKNKKIVLYELTTALLCLLSIFIVSLQLLNINIEKDILSTLLLIDNSIYIIFLIDYIVRLSISKNKVNFIRNNIIDLLSIIPFNSMFKNLRVLKLAKLLKIAKIIKITVLIARFKDDSKEFLNTNYFGYILITTLIFVFICAFGISLVEGLNIGDAIWWSFVTVTSLGYGDIIPTTILGKIIAIILMVIGVGFMGILSGTVSTYFLTKKKSENKYKDKTIQDIRSKLNHFDDLSLEEVYDICYVLKVLKKNEESKEEKPSN